MRWSLGITFALVVIGIRERSIARTSHDIITLTCVGSGSSVSVARQEALSNCKRDAVEFLSKDTKVNSITIETEERVALHSSVEENISVKNLSCDLLKEEIKKINDWVEVHDKCQFDLSTVEIVEDKHLKTPLPSSRVFFENKTRAPASQNQTKYFHSEEYQITISVIPKCTDLLIMGKNPRVLKCESNPMPVVVSVIDSEVVIRAVGFIPKTIKLAPNEKSFNVLLESN